MKKILENLIVILICVFVNGVYCKDFWYNTPLVYTLNYYEAQRSGYLPEHRFPLWRHNSGLNDGRDVGVDLVGGYYDAGDNVKFGFPMAYTVTMLAWSAISFGNRLKGTSYKESTLDAIKWGTDYFIKAHPEPNVLYAQVGDGDSDHACWQRPEDMTTPRTVFRIDESNPGSDLAAETAAALAASAIAFSSHNANYSSLLLKHSKQLFDFAKNHEGKYSDSIPQAGKYYSSSDFQDELMWAAAWLYIATEEKSYKDYLNTFDTAGVRTMFSWDDKYIGVQILIAKLLYEGKVPNEGDWAEHKDQAEQFLCNCIQKGQNNVFKTKGGMLWFNEWNNLQYTVSATFALTVYAGYLNQTKNVLHCFPADRSLYDDPIAVEPAELLLFAKSQVDYILGDNPQNMSYMVGYGSKYPQKIHHRAASIVSTTRDSTHVGCKEGFKIWFNSERPDPNKLFGAIVGGPDKYDNYVDSRSNYQMAEPGTSTPPGLVGVLGQLCDVP
ncbi:hypothetical protein vseg_002482 [Gypsophila vaccaria]